MVLLLIQMLRIGLPASLVLSGCKVNLLGLNHVGTTESSRLIMLQSSNISLCCKKRVVSSAKRMKESKIEDAKILLMYMRKRSGLNTEP